MSFFKKALKSVVKAGVTSFKALAIDPAINAVKSAADITRGDSDRLLSRQGDYVKSQAQNARAVATNALQTSVQLVGGEGIGGSSTKSGAEIRSEKEKSILEAQSASEAKAQADEIAAAPEKERQAMLGKRYQNSLLQGAGRNYGTLLGGGY